MMQPTGENLVGFLYANLKNDWRDKNEYGRFKRFIVSESWKCQ